SALEPWITCCIFSFLLCKICPAWVLLGPMASPVGTCCISLMVSVIAGSRLLRSFCSAACGLAWRAGWSAGSRRKRRRGLSGLVGAVYVFFVDLLSSLDVEDMAAYVIGELAGPGLVVRPRSR